jgi:hypothetical protein
VRGGGVGDLALHRCATLGRRRVQRSTRCSPQASGTVTNSVNPYNTGSDSFVYKDGYQSSTWMTMIHERLSRAHSILREDGVVFCSIDNREHETLIGAFNSVFGKQNRIEELIWVQI